MVKGERYMLHSFKVQILFTVLLTIGCIASHIFASAVLAGAFACALAVTVVISKTGGADHPINLFRRAVAEFLSTNFRRLREKASQA